MNRTPLVPEASTSEVRDDLAMFWFNCAGQIVRRGPGPQKFSGDDEPALAKSLIGPSESGAESWFDVATRGEVVLGRELTVTLPDERTLTLAVSAVPTYDRDGTLTGASALFVDVGQMRRAEESQRLLIEAGRVLASSLDYDETIREALTLFIPRLADFCMIFVREPDDTIRLASVAHSDPVLGAAMEEVLAHHHPDINELGGLGEIIRTGRSDFAPEGVPGLEMAMRAVAPEQAALLEGAGTLGWIAVPLTARERTLGVICFASSHRMRRYEQADLDLAQELGRRVATAIDNARLYALARAAVAARDGVLGIVAHDLRNPVGTIQMTADLLMEGIVDTGEQQKYFGIVRRATERMKRLIQDLLDVTSIEAGHFIIDRQPVEVCALLDEVREMFARQTDEKTQRLEVDAPSGLPAIEVDGERILQVFSNLVGNAVKFTPEGGRIDVRVQRDEAATRFTVIDTGPGIPAHELARVFDRFWQSRRARRGGAGLGLAITKGIVEAHGGSVSVSSVAGEGSAFTFTIPDTAAADEQPM